MKKKKKTWILKICNWQTVDAGHEKRKGGDMKVLSNSRVNILGPLCLGMPLVELEIELKQCGNLLV